jgi:hypothetical protein
MNVASGATGRPSANSVGTQYADVSAAGLHLVAWPRSEAGVELAFVVLLPMNVWLWERPGCPG